MNEEATILYSLLIYISMFFILGTLAIFPLPWLGKGPMHALTHINVKNILLEFEQRRLRAILILILTSIFVFLVEDVPYFHFTSLLVGIGLVKAFIIFLYPLTYKLPNSNKSIVIWHGNINKIADSQITNSVEPDNS